MNDILCLVLLVLGLAFGVFTYGLMFWLIFLIFDYLLIFIKDEDNG